MFDRTCRSLSKQQEEPQFNHWDIFRQVSRENVQLALAVSSGNDTISELVKLLAEYDVLLTQATSIDLYADHIPTQLNEPLPTGNFGLDPDSVSLSLDEPQEEEPQSGHWAVILEFKRENVQLALALSSRNDTISELTKILTEYDVLLTQATSSGLNANHISQQLDEPWSTSNRGLDTHGLSLLLNDPLSLDSHSLSLLVKAEQIWLDGDSQWAYEIADKLAEDQSLSYNEFMRRELFLCAIFHSHEDWDLSSRIFHKINGNYMDTTDDRLETEVNLGVAYFIEGKNLMAVERFEDANLCFEESIMRAPQYSEKARELQLLCCSVDELTS
ncbi:hypothetical protein N7460_002228 [Penicillium canescens]|uniref:Tetratricopeptide repeat protein n=1 Tax=Penicillium canescens TaxID=5083 RepID=A0AAD6IKD2_PENCN|nr:hypothetical protein N7460_002228 [Penicillium canescens]